MELRPCPANLGKKNQIKKTEPINAYITGGIPDKIPISQRIAVLRKPVEKSLAKIANANDTGKATQIDINITKKVPQRAGSNP